MELDPKKGRKVEPEPLSREVEIRFKTRRRRRHSFSRKRGKCAHFWSACPPLHTWSTWSFPSSTMTSLPRWLAAPLRIFTDVLFFIHFSRACSYRKTNPDCATGTALNTNMMNDVNGKVSYYFPKQHKKGVAFLKLITKGMEVYEHWSGIPYLCLWSCQVIKEQKHEKIW